MRPLELHSPVNGATNPPARVSDTDGAKGGCGTHGACRSAQMPTKPLTGLSPVRFLLFACETMRSTVLTYFGA